MESISFSFKTIFSLNFYHFPFFTVFGEQKSDFKHSYYMDSIRVGKFEDLEVYLLCYQSKIFRNFLYVTKFVFIDQATVKPLMTNVAHHIETSQLIWIQNQLTGFYMMGNIGR